jgi:hypothetical protein
MENVGLFLGELWLHIIEYIAMRGQRRLRIESKKGGTAGCNQRELFEKQEEGGICAFSIEMS